MMSEENSNGYIVPPQKPLSKINGWGGDDRSLSSSSSKNLGAGESGCARASKEGGGSGHKKRCKDATTVKKKSLVATIAATTSEQGKGKQQSVVGARRQTVSDPPTLASEQKRRQDRSIRNRMLRSLKLMKSTSTPSLPKLNNDDLLGNKSNAATWGANGEDNNSGGDRLHSVYHESFGRPLMAHRRSLSPDNTSSTAAIAMLGSRTDRRAAVQPTRLEENIFEDIEEAVAKVHAAAVRGVEIDMRPGGGVPVYERHDSNASHSKRRLSMPAILAAPVMNEMRRHDNWEKMDRNAMKYLPKILRDTYAQRQTERPSMLGEARLASIDLRLRLQRPDNLPHYQDIRGSILILDLSGFTALGERLRAELGPRDGAAEFANRVNGTLSSMVKEVHKYWGDVLMFAGDALICLFEAKDRGETVLDEKTGVPLNADQKTKKRVRECCLSVLGHIAIERDLTIHGGAAHGMIRCFFLGTPSKSPGSCAFIVSGKPLKQTGKLLNKAGRGEVYIDGEGCPLTEKEGGEFISHTQENQTESDAMLEELLEEQDEVLPRDDALLSDQDLTVELVGGFDVNAHAKAYLGTLAARRLDQGQQNAMSMLLNELRPVAIVFVGLHDLDDIDPRDSTLLQLMNEAFKTLSRITHACNGAVRDMLFDDKGCVFISVFGAHSHEVNTCFDATISAMRMENALKDLRLERFSLGVSYGECFCGEVGPPMRSDYVVMGPEVNMAARLMGKAPNRSTLVSRRIFTRSEEFIHFLKSEEIQVKGKDGFFHAYIPQGRIDRQNIEVNEPSQPFVIMPSRQNAMDSLIQVRQRALQGEPMIAFVSGGPFLGKSRLINEVVGKKSSEKIRVLKSFRTSLDSFTSFFPLRQIVSTAMIVCATEVEGGFGIGNEIAAANYLVEQNVFNKTDRVNIGSIVPTVADAQLLSLLSGINPKARTRSIVDSLMKILKLLQPLMIILEGDGDIDPSTWSLLAELLKRASTECPRIMLVVSSRDAPTITSAASNLRRNAVQIKLTPFEKYETEQYLRVLLGVKESSTRIDERLLDVVHDRANGCPLFIECVTRWAREKDMIEFVEVSKKMSLKTLDENSDDVTAAIPRELSNILLAPFNKLPPPLWDVLKIASCIGYSFDADLYSTLNKVLDFMPKIRELAADYDCFEQTGSHFRWRQQAVFEAVKSLLMVNQRQKIHRMIVLAFEQSKVNHIDDIRGGDVRRLLGRHCALAEDWAGAFEQYMRAGERAHAMFNFSEATKMYEEAIDYQAKMTPQPPLRSRMIPTINLGTCLRELARYKEAESVLTRCLNEAQGELSDIELDDELYVRALTALAALYQAQSKYDSARKLFERALPIARNIQESRSSLWLAENIAGYAETLRKSGDLPQAEKHHREALEIRMHAVKEKSCTELELAVSYTQLGCTLVGMRQYNEAYKQHHRALDVRYRYLDFSHGLVSESLNYCAEGLCALDRGGEGIPLALHALGIRKLIFGESHPAYAHALSVLASCYHAVGRYFDACDCLEKCLEICEVAFQKNHANIIPNLMNYGNVLLSTGDLDKAKSVYERAITIHELNFKHGQKARQLEKCKGEVQHLTEKIEAAALGGLANDISEDMLKISLHQRIEPTDVDSKGTPVIVFTDIGRDVDDELALVLLSALKRKHILNPVAVITTLSPEEDRAHLARGSMDALGMADVPVGIGSNGGIDDGTELDIYGADYSRSSPSIYESGVELTYRALESVPPKSAIFLCIASLSDAATFIREHEELFISKVKEVVIMGGVLSTLSGHTLTPDTAYNNNCDVSSARFLYEKCQELRVPTATLSRWAAYGCPIPPTLLDEIAKTEHMVATNIRSVSKLSIDQLWNKVILNPSDPRREKLPSRCDVSWFCRTFMSKGEISKEWTSSVWTLVKKLNMYDPLAVLLCVPAYRNAHFGWKTKVVNDVSHIVVGTSERDTGIKNRLSLYNEYSSLFLYAFQESLHRFSRSEVGRF